MHRKDFVRFIKSGSGDIITFNKDVFKKTHTFDSEIHATKFIEIIHLLSDKKVIYPPISITQNHKNVTYTQNYSISFIPPEHTCAARTLLIGQSILKLQKILKQYDLGLIDARVSNFTYSETGFLLIDLFSIVPLSTYSISSFNYDFKISILNPIMFEVFLGLPANVYHANPLSFKNINYLRLSFSFLSLHAFPHLISLYFQNIIDNLLNLSNPDVVSNFLVFYSKKDDPISFKSSKISPKNDNFLKYLRQKLQSKETSWSKYSQFHNDKYQSKKKSLMIKFIELFVSSGYLMDLGSNNLINYKNSDITIIPIDLDCSIVNRLTFEGFNAILADLSSLFLNKSDNSHKILTYNYRAESALFLGILHHLVITLRLPYEFIFERLSEFYSHVLIEIPHNDDPLVKLLISNSEKKFNWSHTTMISKLNIYFEILDQIEVSLTRTILTCKSLSF